MTTKQEKLKALLEEASPEVLGLLKLKWAVEEISEKYNASVYAHSPDKAWFHLCTEIGESPRLSIEAFVNTDNEVRVHTTAMPVRRSMAKLDLGEFSYPNEAWEHQMVLFAHMVTILEDNEWLS